MDIMMPVMNGLEATRAIRASSHPEAKTIPIIAMTANAYAEDVHAALESGMNAHIAKPINIPILLSTLNRYRTKKN
jgi:CheY-like chemotaxis protein